MSNVGRLRERGPLIVTDGRTLDDVLEQDPGLIERRLSHPDSNVGILQRQLLARLVIHEREDTIPTSGRFLWYELKQAGLVDDDLPPRTDGKKGRRPDQDPGLALWQLREFKVIPWWWIEDEGRRLDEWQTAPTVAEYVIEAGARATIDRWDGQPAPLILCESDSLAGALRSIAARYACPIASTKGQAGGFLVTQVAPSLKPGQLVLYVGDWNRAGTQIEANTRKVCVEYSDGWAEDEEEAAQLWERLALTTEQVNEYLPDEIKIHVDKRRKTNRESPSVECEALGQARLMGMLADRLDELMPEPLDVVEEREGQQRAEVRGVLEQLRGEDR